MVDLINISIGSTALIGVLGFAVVFFGVFLLMMVVLLLGRIMQRKNGVKELPVSIAPEAKNVPPVRLPVSVCAGEVELYGTDPRDAAVIMAIVADQLGKPLEELRFKSIKEVK